MSPINPSRRRASGAEASPEIDAQGEDQVGHRHFAREGLRGETRGQRGARHSERELPGGAQSLFEAELEIGKDRYVEGIGAAAPCEQARRGEEEGENGGRTRPLRPGRTRELDGQHRDTGREEAEEEAAPGQIREYLQAPGPCQVAHESVETGTGVPVPLRALPGPGSG